MALAKGTVDPNEPSEFGGIPGLYANSDPAKVKTATGKIGLPYDTAEPLKPHQVRMALTQTNSADKDSRPAYGDGGKQT